MSVSAAELTKTHGGNRQACGAGVEPFRLHHQEVDGIAPRKSVRRILAQRPCLQAAPCGRPWRMLASGMLPCRGCFGILRQLREVRRNSVRVDGFCTSCREAGLTEGEMRAERGGGGRRIAAAKLLYSRPLYRISSRCTRGTVRNARARWSYRPGRFGVRERGAAGDMRADAQARGYPEWHPGAGQGGRGSASRQSAFIPLNQSSQTASARRGQSLHSNRRWSKGAISVADHENVRVDPEAHNNNARREDPGSPDAARRKIAVRRLVEQGLSGHGGR